MCACGADGPASQASGPSGGTTASGGDPGVGGAPSTGGTSSGGLGSGGTGAAAAGGTSSGGGGTDTCGSGGLGSGGNSGGSTFVLSSPALWNVEGCSLETPAVCNVFPDENVSYQGNANLSPELHWTGAPEGTQSFALVLFDVTYGQAHWALWNIPANVGMLPANIAQDTATPPTPAGSRQANANFATTSDDGYFGPHMPCNVFELRLYALSTSSFTPMDPESAVLVSIELEELGDVLGVARLTGRSNDYDATCG